MAEEENKEEPKDNQNPASETDAQPEAEASPDKGSGKKKKRRKKRSRKKKEVDLSIDPNSPEAKAKRKQLRIFIFLAVANSIIVIWLVFTLFIEVSKSTPDITELEAQSIDVIEDVEALKELEETIPIEPFLVTVVADHKGRSRLGQKVLRIRMEFLPETDGARRKIENFNPKIRDEMNLILSSQSYADLSLAEGREALRNLIKSSINEIIRPEKIQRVYFLEFVVN